MNHQRNSIEELIHHSRSFYFSSIPYSNSYLRLASQHVWRSINYSPLTLHQRESNDTCLTRYRPMLSYQSDAGESRPTLVWFQSAGIDQSFTRCGLYSPTQEPIPCEVSGAPPVHEYRLGFQRKIGVPLLCHFWPKVVAIPQRQRWARWDASSRRKHLGALFGHIYPLFGELIFCCLGRLLDTDLIPCWKAGIWPRDHSRWGLAKVGR